MRGRLALEQEDFELAESHLTEALVLSRNLRGDYHIGTALRSLGRLELVRGDFVKAACLLEESVLLFRNLGFKDGAAGALCYLGRVELERGCLDSRTLVFLPRRPPSCRF